ncbi:putative cyclin-d6-1 [Phtheirospermum japonicum]|uniref:Putative cyclin-d6-1 n=1 Tax=Phtheirospermum japonicum TaxID=374723 RepID=A0A830BH34_9LAMI|nr:putative cyclin-d6-1 [Phtheirospermum japonicum]
MRVLRATGNIRNRAIFAICCLTIPWKLRDKSFVLRIFLRERDILYSTEDVRQMELAICRGLEWRMRTVTPFLFVGFFIPFLGLPLARSSVHDLIYKSQRDIAFIQYRLSVIAAFAMLTVSSGTRNKASISCKG